MVIYIDCTNTYTSSLHTGIQRVVGNIVKELSDNSNVEVKLVILSDNKITIIDSLNRPETIDGRLSFYKNLKKWLIKIFPFKFLEKFLYAPKDEFGLNFFVLKVLSLYKKIYLKKEVYDLSFIQENDVLLLLDSSWEEDIWNVVKDLKERKIQIITVIYDLIPLLYPEFCSSGLQEKFKNWINNVYRYSNIYISISNSVNKELQEYFQTKFNDNLSNKHFSFFYLGADFNSKKVESQYIRKNLNEFYKNSTVYLNISTIEPRKNQLYLLNSFEQLWSKGIDIKLCLIGRRGSTSYNIISDFVQKSRFEKKLLWIENATDDELKFVYEKSKSLIFPSFAEGFGLPLIEALSLSLPVITSDIAVHREIGKNSVMYINPNNINSLVSMIIKIENNLLKFKYNIKYKCFTWEESAKQLLREIIYLNNKVKS